MIGAITPSINPGYCERLAAGLAQQTRKPEHHTLVANSRNVHAREVGNNAWDTVLFPGYNAPFSVANNLAAREMPDTVTHLLLLNDDLILLHPHFIEQLWETRRDADIVGALFIQNDGTVNHGGGCELNIEQAWGEHILRGARSAEMGGINAAPTVPWVTFAGVLINRELWDHLGGLDESFVWSHEDHDFCLRAIEQCAKIVCQRCAVAQHDECGTRPRGAPYEVANAQLFQGRWGGARLRAALSSYKQRFPEAEGIPL